ncbi:MAG: hypothetical protein CVU39_04225 [Chloroflexi bacterium HGW-Chloroflexi-10]|nr:MAG: hypothetical protein CVU39_04225 [Chloroflexi bacterium HGW-Chloroflexi-10]
MRQGNNPAKYGALAYQPERLGIATITYIPFLGGFYQNCWDVFLAHINSVHAYTQEKFNYLVFDNGSCPEIKAKLLELQQAGKIDWLISSTENLGKTGALNWIFASMPNEWICFADSDMLFRPGWLEASWQINKNFPNCGMIGAQFIYPDRVEDKGNTKFRKTQDSRYEFSQYFPEKWMVTEYCRARGIPEERWENLMNAPFDRVLDSASGTEALLGGNSHQQYLAKKEVLKKILPLPDLFQLSREEDTYQDVKIDQLGYLHLTTTRPYLYHMGNTIEPEIQEEVAKLGQIKPKAEAQVVSGGLLNRFLLKLSKNAFAQKIMFRLYNKLYAVLSLSRK